MMRFAAAIVLLQGAFIMVGGLVVPLAPAFTEPDLLALDWPGGRFAVERMDRYGLPCFDINAPLPGTDGSRDVWVSVRLWSETRDYDTRRSWDRDLVTAVGEPRRTFADESLRGELGYRVEYLSRGEIYVELVRHRGNVMLIVRVSQDRMSPGKEGVELPRCRMFAREVMRRARLKLDWPDGPEAAWGDFKPVADNIPHDESRETAASQDKAASRRRYAQAGNGLDDRRPERRPVGPALLDFLVDARGAVRPSQENDRTPGSAARLSDRGPAEVANAGRGHDPDS